MDAAARAAGADGGDNAPRAVRGADAEHDPGGARADRCSGCANADSIRRRSGGLAAGGRSAARRAEAPAPRSGNGTRRGNGRRPAARPHAAARRRSMRCSVRCRGSRPPGARGIYADKQLKPVRLRLGITDGQNTEVIEGDIKEGAEVVTNVVDRQARPRVRRRPRSRSAGRRVPGGGFPGGGGIRRRRTAAAELELASQKSVSGVGLAIGWDQRSTSTSNQNESPCHRS